MDSSVANINIVIKFQKIKKNNIKKNVNENYTKNFMKTEEYKMEKNLNQNLKEATNYLIQLFYKTGEKYSCTRTKLGKLLTIVAFVYARKNQSLFLESIYKYSNCGTSINTLALFIDREVYIVLKNNDDKKYIDMEFDDDAFIPGIYTNINNVDTVLKKTIEDVFRNFGAYTACDLGELIMPIIDIDNVVNSNNEINLERIYSIQKEELKNIEKNNEVIKYIF